MLNRFRSVTRDLTSRPFIGGVSPYVFGGAGDGVTDDSVAMAAAIASGRAVDLSGGAWALGALSSISSSTTCPGLFSDGTGVIKAVSTTTSATTIFTITKSDFFFDRIFFDLPVSTDPVVPPTLDRAIYVGTSTAVSRLSVTNCRINGGKFGIVFQGPNQYLRIANNTITNSWAEGITVTSPTYCEIVDNTLTDGGYGTDPGSGAAYGTVTNAGAGLSNGTRTFTVTNGRPVTPTQFTATVSGGVIVGDITITVAGSYLQTPPITGDFPFVPTVTVDSGIVGGATFTLIPYATASGAIRVNSSTMIALGDMCIISRNIIARWNQSTVSGTLYYYTQEGIDVTGSASRSIIVSNNDISDCGNGGIEIKPNAHDVVSPDVYRDILVADNNIRMPAVRGTGIALNISESSPASGKIGRVKVSGNLITCNAAVTTGLAQYGVTISAYADVTVSDNYIINLASGVQIAPNENGTAATASRIDVSRNNINVVDYAIMNSSPGATIAGLTIGDNKIVCSTGRGLLFTSCAINNAYIDGNYISAAASYGMELRDIHTGTVSNNTILAGINGVLTQGTAPENVRFVGNRITTSGGSAADAFNLGSGTGLQVLDNYITIPVAYRTVTGAATYTAAGNIRGMVTADPSPTYAASLGDIFRNSSPSSGGVKDWICTTAGGAASAVFKGTAIP